MISLREMRSNIWRGLSSATDQEIADGLSFYPGANGLCRFLAKIHNLSTKQVAGIYSALSPLNNWHSNVANILDIIRYRESAIVNTTDTNKRKALEILSNPYADPIDILNGRKTQAFYRAIHFVDDTDPIAIDRHLVCLAIGEKIVRNISLSSILTDDLYSRIESVYYDLGKRESIGNRLASIAWFVQRRIERDQITIIDPRSPICCGKLMIFFGRKPVRRYKCTSCGRLLSETQPRFKPNVNDIQLSFDVDRDKLSIYNSRPIIRLSRKGYNDNYSRQFSNSCGWQYLSRFVVMYRTGEKLSTDEHVHHTNGNLLDCRDDNLEVWLAEHHGRYHANHQLLYMLRDKRGRFAPCDPLAPVPPFVVQYSRAQATQTDEPLSTGQKQTDMAGEVPF